MLMLYFVGLSSLLLVFECKRTQMVRIINQNLGIKHILCFTHESQYVQVYVLSKMLFVLKKKKTFSDQFIVTRHNTCATIVLLYQFVFLEGFEIQNIYASSV